MNSSVKSELRVLFISAIHTPFIQDDLDFLDRHFKVKKFMGHGLFHAIRIAFAVPRTDVVFCWFASVYAFVAVAVGKYFGVRSVIVVGGVDVAKEEELGYGMWISPWKARLVRYALRNAALVLAVDQSLKEEAVRLAEYDGENIMCLPTGYDSAFWKPMGEKETIVLTVAAVRHHGRLRVKGMDILMKVARKFPDCKFIVVGVSSELINSLRPPENVEFLSTMNRDDLLSLYRRANIYCQPSLREGLPNTLCEAMLCGCIPVATDVGGTRIAVGDTGVLVPSRNVDALADGIRAAFTMSNEVREKARARIVSLFPKEKREHELLRVVSRLKR